MKKLLLILILLLLPLFNVKASMCVYGLGVEGRTYRVNGHQNMWLPNGKYNYRGDLDPGEDIEHYNAACFEITDTSIVTVRLNQNQFEWQPHTFGNADIRVKVNKECLCDGVDSLEKTIHFMLSEWGLRDLEVEGYKLSPNFHNSTFVYRVTVPNNVQTVKINATANWSTSKIVGTGTKVLKEGENKFVINVTTVEGDSRNYTVYVTREKPINATSIKIDGGDITLQADATKELTYSVTPTNASPAVTWTSTNPTIVSVSETGLITAKKAGQATITVRTDNLTSSINVNVIGKVDEIVCDDTITLYKNETKLLEYTVLPADALNKEVRFRSLDEELFNVSSDGLITAFDKKGTSYLLITSEESGYQKQVKVIVESKLESISFPVKNMEIYVGETKKLNLNLVPDDASAIILFQSSDPTVVDVNSVGVIKGLSEGTSTITARSSDNLFFDDITITVTQKEGTSDGSGSIDGFLVIAIIIVSGVIIYLLFNLKKNKSN